MIAMGAKKSKRCPSARRFADGPLRQDKQDEVVFKRELKREDLGE